MPEEREEANRLELRVTIPHRPSRTQSLVYYTLLRKTHI